MKMDSSELKWVKQASLESLFNLYGERQERLITRFPTNLGSNKRWKNLKVSTWSRNFYWSCTYSWATWNFQGGNNRCYKCNFWKSKNRFKKNCRSTCWEWALECSVYERRISCEICNHFANSLSKKEGSLFQQPNCYYFWPSQ